MFKLCSQHHITYNSVSRSMSREREMEKKDMDTPPGRSKEKKEEKDRKERKRVSTHRTLAPPPSAAFCHQDSNICSRPASLSGPHRQRPRDERGSQAEEGRERNQYVGSPRQPSILPPRTLLTLLLLSPNRLLQKQQELQSLVRLAALCGKGEEQEIQIFQQGEGRVGETWTSVLGSQKGESVSLQWVSGSVPGPLRSHKIL